MLPSVKWIAITNYTKNHNIGTYSGLNVTTYPRNYVNANSSYLNPYYGKIEWKSTNSNVAEVSRNTGVIHFKALGIAKVYAVYSDGLHQPVKSAEMTFVVNKPSSTLRIIRGPLKFTDYIVTEPPESSKYVPIGCVEDADDTLHNYENVYEGATRTWDIYSNYGWYYTGDGQADNLANITTTDTTLTYTAKALPSNLPFGHKAFRLYIHEKVTGSVREISIIIHPKKQSVKSKTQQSYFKVERNIDNAIVFNNYEYLIEDFSRTWTIDTNCNWKYKITDNNNNIQVSRSNNKLIITALKWGEPKIQLLTIVNGKEYNQGTFQIKVEPKVQRIDCAKETSIKKDKQLTLTAFTWPKIYKNSTKHGTLTWTSSNDKIAKVISIKDNQATILATGLGKTTITVKYSDGKPSHTATTTIKISVDSDLGISRPKYETKYFKPGSESETILQNYSQEWNISSTRWHAYTDKNNIIRVVEMPGKLKYTAINPGTVNLTIKDSAR